MGRDPGLLFGPNDFRHAFSRSNDSAARLDPPASFRAVTDYIEAQQDLRGYFTPTPYPYERGGREGIELLYALPQTLIDRYIHIYGSEEEFSRDHLRSYICRSRPSSTSGN